MWEKNNANGKGSGTYDWTSLISSDKKKLLQLLPSQLQEKDTIFPETKEMVVKIWRHFDSLYHLINTDSEENGDPSLEVFEKSKKLGTTKQE